MAQAREELLTYQIQGGAFAGKFLTFSLLTGNLAHWSKYLKMLDNYTNNVPFASPNHLHKALRYLVPIVRRLQPVEVCQVCGKYLATKFILRDYGGWFAPINPGHICCHDEICQTTCRHWSLGFLRQINYSAFEIRSVKGKQMFVDKNEVMKMIAKAYCLPEKLNSKTAIDYLRSRIDGSFPSLVS